MWPSTTTRASASRPSCPIRPTNRPPASSTWPRQHFARFGFSIQRVLTDNGPCYRSIQFGQALQPAQYQAPLHPALHAAHQRKSRALHPDRHPRMGLRTLLPELSGKTTTNFNLWLHDYNFHRPHASLNLNTPASRASLNRNNLLTLHTYSLIPAFITPPPAPSAAVTPHKAPSAHRAP